jgi:hypothetical protein
MRTLTTEIGSSVTNILKISPCFWDGVDGEGGGVARMKEMRRGSRRRLGEDEAASTIGPGLGKQTLPPTTAPASLEEEEDDHHHHHSCTGEAE